VAIAPVDARSNHIGRGVEFHEKEVRNPPAQKVAVAALERRAGHHARTLGERGTDPFEPRLAHRVIKRLPRRHAGDRLGGMQVVGVDEWQTELGCEQNSDVGLTHRGWPHHNDMRLIHASSLADNIECRF